MKIGCSLFLLLVWAKPSLGSMESSYQEGGAFANGVSENAKAAVNQAPLNEVPGFTTSNPSQANLNPHEVTEAVQNTLAGHETGQQILEAAKVRPRFTIDPNTNPLFTHYDPVKAESQLEIEDSADPSGGERPIEKNCEEGGEEITYECFENRHVTPTVAMKEATLSVNHLIFTPKIETHTETIEWPVQVNTEHVIWEWYSRTEERQRQNGWFVSLPKEMVAFKQAFCPAFRGIDAKTGKAFTIDCSRIQRYKVNNATSTTESNGVFTFWVPERFLNLTLSHDTYEGEEIDEWQSTCEGLEAWVEEGLCQYGERTVSIGPETRTILGYPITKDVWQYRSLYHCKLLKDECASLRAQGCYPVGSRCKELRQGRCWVYEQTYHCPNGQRTLTKKKSPGSQAFCLTGDCHPATYSANGDMLEAIARLNVLKEVQDDIRLQGHASFQIFKGQDNRCSRNCINFKDCCGGMKGWGVSLHFSNCDSEEKALAQKRDKHLCHLIGTYCSKKILGKCVTKKTSFCCFGSRLSRLVHEQGRAQLGLGWGAPQEPDCRGLTVEELARLNLSAMNFRELFDDLIKKYTPPDAEKLTQKTVKKIQETVKQMETGLKAPEGNVPKKEASGAAKMSEHF